MVGRVDQETRRGVVPQPRYLTIDWNRIHCPDVTVKFSCEEK